MNQVKPLIKETKKYLTKYDYEKVSELCNKILKIDSESSFGLQFKGISYFQRGYYKEAIPYYEKLLKLYPDDNELKYTLAFLYEKIGDNEEVLSYYNKINDYFIYQKRTRFLTKIGRYDILIKEYDEKLASLKTNEKKYDPKILVLMEEKAVFHYRNKEYEKSYMLFKEISENYPQVLQTITHPMKRCEYWYNTLHYYLKEYEEPIEFFNNLFILDEEDNGWSNKLHHNISSGDCYVFGDLLIELNPNNIDLLQRYGDYARYTFTEYALNCFFKILEIEPNNKEVINKMISIYTKEYSKDKALKLIDSKINNSYLGLDLLREKIELLESMTLYPEALEAYEEYFKYATGNDKELTSMKVNHIICTELYALDLYNQDKLEQSYNVLKDTYYYFKKITNYWGEQVSIAWYSSVLKDAIDKSENNPEVFFKYFYTPNDKQTKIWIKKIDSISSYFEPQKNIGNKSYYDILFEKNQNNYELAISEARKYYYGIQRPRIALPLYNRVLKIDPDNKEVLNHKFSMLLTAKQYYEAYNLLTKMEIDFPIIAYSLRKLAEFYIENNEHEKSKYCLNLLLKEEWSYKILKKLKHVWHKSNDRENQEKCSYYMDWINLINYKNDECNCPVCGNKLIPIKYGVVWANDSEFKNGKFYASEKINTHKHRPTDYCKNCKKVIYMGLCGIDITEDITKLANYSKEIIIWLIEYLENNPQRTLNEIEKIAYWKFSLDHQEFRAFIEKLEQIKFLKVKQEHLILHTNYNQFKHSIKEKYHYGIKIFKNEQELKEYSHTCSKFKDYDNLYEFIEDIKISLMASSWHYSYESATERLKGDECELQGDYEARITPYDIAMEVGYTCG